MSEKGVKSFGGGRQVSDKVCCHFGHRESGDVQRSEGAIGCVTLRFINLAIGTVIEIRFEMTGHVSDEY